MRMIFALLIATAAFADTIVGTRPRVEMDATRVTWLQAQRTANTIYWQRFKSRCDTKIDAGTGVFSYEKARTIACAGLLSLMDDTLTHTGSQYNGEKYARITWIFGGALVNSRGTLCNDDVANEHRTECWGFALAYDWAYHDQTGSSAEFTAVQNQLIAMCNQAATGSNPNVVAGDLFSLGGACLALGSDYASAQSKWDTVWRPAWNTYFTNFMTGAGGYFAGGDHGEGVEYGWQTITLLMRFIDSARTATGEDIAAIWNPAWPNSLVDALYAWTTPSGLATSFSYSIPLGTASCTGCTMYEMLAFGDLQNAELNTPSAIRAYAKAYREGALYALRYFREQGDTNRAAYMQYYVNTFLPYWSYSSMTEILVTHDPWMTEFLALDPSQAATDYNTVNGTCYQVTGQRQAICKNTKDTSALHLFYSGGGGHVGHSADNAGAISLFVNNIYAMNSTIGYFNAAKASRSHSTVLVNGHGSFEDGAVSWQGGSSRPLPGTMTIAEHAGYAAIHPASSPRRPRSCRARSPARCCGCATPWRR